MSGGHSTNLIINRKMSARLHKNAVMCCFKYSTRFVILFKKYVIKIPICRKGFLQGYNEKRIWNKYKENALLAELKWMYLGIVCQKKYTTIQYVPQNEVAKIKKLIPEFDFDNCDFWNYENWGKDGEEYILLDYGNSPYVAGLYK
jgi:hypothetical protein